MKSPETRAVGPSLRRKMSHEEYLDHPRLPGWSYRYADGELQAASAQVVVPLELRLPVERKAEAPPGSRLRPLAEGDDPVLVELFVEAFTDTMEYVGAGEDEIRRSARESLERGPLRRRGARHVVSYVAEDAEGPVGAALFRHGRKAPLLDLVFVVPAWQRRGLADALVTRAAERFAELGEVRLFSSAMIGNDPSLAWHRRFGFREIPHFLVAAHRAEVYRYEHERQARLGRLDADDLERLEAEAGRWEEEHRRLRELALVDRRAAFPNIY